MVLGVGSWIKGGSKSGGVINGCWRAAIYLNHREQPGLGCMLWERLRLIKSVCSGRTWFLKNPGQVSLQGPPRLRVGSGMGWKPSDPEPFPPGRIAPPVGLCSPLLSFWGCHGNAASGENLSRTHSRPAKAVVWPANPLLGPCGSMFSPRATPIGVCASSQVDGLGLSGTWGRRLPSLV